MSTTILFPPSSVIRPPIPLPHVPRDSAKSSLAGVIAPPECQVHGTDPARLLLPVSDPFVHLQPQMYVANLATIFEKMGLRAEVMSFSRVQGWTDSTRTLTCIAPQPASANSDVLHGLLQAGNSLIWVPGEAQVVLLRAGLDASSQMYCVLPQGRAEAATGGNGQRAVQELALRLRPATVIAFTSRSAIVARYGAAARVVRGFCPLKHSAGLLSEAFVAGLVASISTGSETEAAVSVGLAEIANIWANDHILYGVLSMQEARSFITGRNTPETDDAPLKRLWPRVIGFLGLQP